MVSVSKTNVFLNTDGNYFWNDANNWSTRVLPTSGSTVEVSKQSLDDIPDLSLAALTVDSGGAVFTEAVGVHLTVGSLTLLGTNQFGIGSLGGTVTITGPVTVIGPNAALVAENPGAVLDDEASVDPGAGYEVIAGGEVILAARPASTSKLAFAGSGTIALKNPGATIANSVLGLAPGDAMELPGTKVVQVGAAGSDLKITTDQGTFDFTSVSYASAVTGYTDNGVDAVTGLDKFTFTTGSNIVACYCRGTLIATRTGEVAVEALAIGDEVMTGAGTVRPIKWIGRRSYGGRFLLGQRHLLPVCIKADALDDNVPMRDLWISPHHAMFIDGVLIEARDLLNGVSIVQAKSVEKVEYFHIELETHDVIIAEGAPSESFIDDDSRGMFDNAHEYRALFPDAVTTQEQYCAPRHYDGYEVEAARQRIALRAGLTSGDEQTAGTLRGYVDLVSPTCIAGWAQNADHSEAAVCLDIYAGARLIGQTLANQYREDLEQAKLGSGCHGFAFTPPAGLAFAPDAVEVRRSLDGAALEFSTATRRPTTSGNQATPRCPAPAPSHPQIKV